jgi:secreted trypsin-like serine protease
MKRLPKAVLLAGLLLSCGVDTGSSESNTATTEQPIVRGTGDNGDRAVVMLIEQLTNGATIQCSGTYVAPRVVLTAAHCISPYRWLQGTFVYWGNDYATDQALLVSKGAGPSTLSEPQSVWAKVETVQVMPSYSSSMHSGDLAFVYLDRLPPIIPMPIYPQRVDDTWIGKPGRIVGWGGSQALTADISQVTGARQRRTGTALIAGTPTRADYHTDDPNPGMLDATTRATYLKTDGTSPRSNVCAGDSGGAIIIHDKGIDWLAGVSMWTGLWCEDYSIFTRLDSFKTTVNGALPKGGLSPIVPRLECVNKQADGSYTAYYGYDNTNLVTMSLPDGPLNGFPLDSAKARPQTFEIGDFPFAFDVPFSAKQDLLYWLLPLAGPLTVLHANTSSPTCGANNVGVSCVDLCNTALAAKCDPPVSSMGTFAECTQMCVQATQWLDPSCQAVYAAANACSAKVDPNDPNNWWCGEGYAPSPMACFDEWNAVWACGG